MKFQLIQIGKSIEIVERTAVPTRYFFDWLSKLYTLLAGTLGQGYTGTIVTAKLTSGGANGSMTFVNGVVTAQTAAS